GAGALYLKTHTLSTVSRTQVRAGDLDGALTAADAAITLARTFDPEGTVLVTALQRRAEALTELGRTPEAQQTLAEAVRLLERAGSAPSEFNALLAIRIALDQGRLDQARDAFAALAPLGESAPVAKSVQRILSQADIALARNDTTGAARLAAEAIARATSSGQVATLGSAISDGELIEGLAHLRAGDAAAARPLLDSALSRRTALYLPKSPRIAEAQLALAACALAQGQRQDATTLLAQAEAIQAQHSALSPRYRLPLQHLRAQLGTHTQ
ncbi:MAG: tetratricopeptide repeat protein, partial [Pseudoxanthomonas sp.]